MKPQDKIVILGCGFSGMITALSFANKGVRSTVIEARDVSDQSFTDDMRTTALTPFSKEFFSKIGIWEALSKVTSQINDIYVVDNKAPQMLHFETEKALGKNISTADTLASGASSSLGYMIKNHEFKQILLDKVKGNPYIELIDNTTYTKIESNAAHTILHLSNGYVIKCELAIVCDGYNSKARGRYFSSKVNKSYNQIALTFNITHENPHEGTAVEHFMPNGPFAILPLRDEFSSAIVWTLPPAQGAIYPKLDIEELEYLLQKNCGDFLGKVRIATRVSSYPLNARISSRYFYNRILLLADSAHTIHPLAGQGLNQGIKDIAELVDLIAPSHAYAKVTDEALQSYEAAREGDNMRMYLITDNLNRIFSNHLQSLSLLRRSGLKLIDSVNVVKRQLIKYASSSQHNV